MVAQNLNVTRITNFLIGPLLLLVALIIPVFGPVQARFGIGILLWMVYWWVTVPVNINITCVVPLIAVAFYPFLPVEKVMQMYVHRLFFLIVGAAAVTAAWVRWGLAKRMALRFLLFFGNDVRKQTVGWFLFCGVLTMVMPNTVVAAVFAPIAVACLAYSGFQTFDQIWGSRAASNMLIAIAWGASVGGMSTPLGGGQAVLTYGLFEKYLGHEVFFIDWTMRMLPLSLLVIAALAVFLYYGMGAEIQTLKGGKEFYRKELEEMGPMSYEEKVTLYGFLVILLLALLRPLYAGAVKGPWWEWLRPEQLFFIFAVILFFMPARSARGETILSASTLAKNFPITIIFIWPASIALGRILTETGAAKVLGQWATPFVGLGDIQAITAVAVMSSFLSQPLTDTATAGIMIPFVIETFKNWHGLPFGAVAFIWIAGAALSFSYPLPSSTGAQGVVAGYGANLKRMFVYGIVAALISLVITVVYFVVTVAVLQMDFYILPPSK